MNTQKTSCKDFKELEIILSSFTCDKHCPYCTAKITKWDEVSDDIHMLSLNVGQFKELGYTFHYVTIGGNGEPTLHPYKKLKEIVEMFDGYDIPIKRVLTSGNVFRPEEKKKYDLFVNHGWVFEVTVTSADFSKSNKLQGYDFYYFDTPSFKNSMVRMNYVLLKENTKNMGFVNDIVKISRNYPNIETIALKFLNINTKTQKIDPDINESCWIANNFVAPSHRDEIKAVLDAEFEYVGEKFDTHSWRMPNGKEVYFSWKRVTYGMYDLVWYGNRFVNYQLETIELPLLPKIYVASRFIKENEKGVITFKNDFRTKLIGTEKDFVDFNNHSFIYSDAGATIAQYIGPFYNEKASDGTLTSTACEEVVNTENELIEKCDVFICYLDEILSPGGINELTYASLLGKKIIIFYKTEPHVKYKTQTSSWYPITFSMLKSDNCSVFAVDGVEEVVKKISKIISLEQLKK